MYVGVCLSVNISALPRGRWEGEDRLNGRGSLPTVMMISDYEYTYIFFSLVFVHTSKWDERFRVTGEDPVFNYSVNLPDNLSLSVYVLEKRMDI